MAAAITKKIKRSVLDCLYAPSAYDPEHERIKAERFLQQHLFKWTQDEQQHEQEQSGSFTTAKLPVLTRSPSRVSSFGCYRKKNRQRIGYGPNIASAASFASGTEAAICGYR
jgi:hypothetical protein